ncbi:hypothetical protein D3C78_1643690 [compost metagenome]
MARAQFAGALGAGDHQVAIDGGEGAFGARLAPGRAEAAEGRIHGARQFRQDLPGIAVGVFQVRVGRQGASTGRQHTLDGGFVEYAIKQMLAGQAAGAEDKQVAGAVGVRHGCCHPEWPGLRRR